MKKILEVERISKRYRDFTLEDVTFSLEQGYIMGLIGPNGAGKSTVVRLIMNLIKADGGRVLVCGQEVRANEQAVKEKIGFVFDETYAYGILTVQEMKRIIAPFYRTWNEACSWNTWRASRSIRRRRSTISRGMKTKFSLSIALSHGAELIIMDEPTSGLDPVFRSELLDVLYGIIQEGKVSILFSTHITSDLERIADYITFLNNGRVVFSETKDAAMSGTHWSAPLPRISTGIRGAPRRYRISGTSSRDSPTDPRR
jgi:ABC-2 type transport system ATP-binding protein